MSKLIQHSSKRQWCVFISICLFLFSVSTMGAVASTSEDISARPIYRAPSFQPPDNSPGIGITASANATSVSDDGRYVTILQIIADSDGVMINYCGSAYVLDTQTTVLKEVASLGCNSTYSIAPFAQIFPNSRYVAVQLTQAIPTYQPIGEDTPYGQKGQVLLYDMNTGSSTVISSSSSGEWGNRYSTLIGVSEDSRTIVFRSHATNLVPNDTNGAEDSFVYDTVNETVTLISLAQEENFYRPSDVSADGRFRVISTRDALTPDDTDDNRDIYVQDLTTGSTQLISTYSYNYSPHISANGRYIVFTYNGEVVYMTVNPLLETTPDDTPEDDGDCIIPVSGPWPQCARNGGGTPAQPPVDEGESCIIPVSGPWPQCARNGEGTPAQPPIDEGESCIIPVSGPWPECARNGGGTSAQPPVNEGETCIIPVSGRWPACARNR